MKRCLTEIKTKRTEKTEGKITFSLRGHFNDKNFLKFSDFIFEINRILQYWQIGE